MADNDRPQSTAEESRFDLPAGVAVAAGAYAVVTGTVTLLGWMFDRPRLTDWAGVGISMFPNTAVCAIASGAGVALLCGNRASRYLRYSVRTLAMVVAVIGGLTLVQHVSGLNLEIDTILFDRPWGQRAAASPMRMGPPASASFLIFDVSLFLASAGPRERRLASALAALSIAIASLSLIGYGFGSDQLYTAVHLTGIAFQTSTVLAALALGMMAGVPEWGIAALLSRDDPGGMLVRRLLLPIIIVPLLIGWLVLLGRQADYYDTPFGLSIMLLTTISMLLGLLTWTAFGIGRATQATRQSQAELAEKDRRKTEFLATLAHELRNPLAPIRNALELLSISTPSGSNADLVQGIMRRQLGHLVRLVDDLLEVSRITSGKIELRHERVEIAAVLRTAVETSKPLIETYGHSMVLSLPEENLAVVADFVRISQVVANLLNNAAKYTEPGGKIWLSASRDNGHVAVSVRDTGIGISPDMLPHLFQMFSQADRDHKRAQGGLGIGLALAKGLVQMHGGSIEARSEGEGCGSEFIVRLPLSEPPAGPHFAALGRDRTVNDFARGCRVLVVDDNHDAALSLAMLLRTLGHEVETAYHGVAALERVRAFQPTVVLLDLGMPEMSGYEVAERIQSMPEGRRCALVALTGWGQEEDRQRTKEAGFKDHLVKPVELAKLKKLLAELPAESTASANSYESVGAVREH